MTRPFINTLSIVGDVRHRQFQPLCLELAQHAGTVHHFETPDHVEPPSEQEQTVTVVLQAWSDQYSRSQISRLAGLHIFGRLYCCYGPACESDARNRDLWPDAVRVSLRLARETILADLRERKETLPLTAAADEVFAHRVIRTLSGPPIGRVAIITPDAALRKSLSQLLTHAGISSVGHDLLTGTEAEPDEAVDIVLHDLDPWGAWMERSLTHAAELYPFAESKGLASMPDAGLMTELADLPVSEIIPKLDAVNALLPALTRPA